MDAATDGSVQPQSVDHPVLVNPADSINLGSIAELTELFEWYMAAHLLHISVSSATLTGP